jgi:hypothetical protein
MAFSEGTNESFHMKCEMNKLLINYMPTVTCVPVEPSFTAVVPYSPRCQKLRFSAACPSSRSPYVFCPSPLPPSLVILSGQMCFCPLLQQDNLCPMHNSEQVMGLEVPYLMYTVCSCLSPFSKPPCQRRDAL